MTSSPGIHSYYDRVIISRSIWRDSYVKGTVFVSQHLLQPSIITSSLWLIQEKLKIKTIAAQLF